jgi:hypothetical protein
LLKHDLVLPLSDPRAPSNAKKLTSNLNEIHNIMCQNIDEILQRGDKLDSVANKSHRLLEVSKRYEKDAKNLNLQALYRTLGPLVAIALVIGFILYLRFFR